MDRDSPEIPDKRVKPPKATNFSELRVLAAVAVIVILAAVFGRPAHTGHRKSALNTEALNHARQIGLSLHEFEQTYGRFPDASTIAPLQATTHTKQQLGTDSSNQLLRQLIVAGLRSEMPFWVKSAASKHKPDNNFTPGEALKPGECTFAYIPGLSSKDHPQTPVLLAPLVPGTTRFDPKPFKGKAIVLRADLSAVMMQIAHDGSIPAGGGKDILDPSRPWWKGRVPDLKLPESP